MLWKKYGKAGPAPGEEVSGEAECRKTEAHAAKLGQK